MSYRILQFNQGEDYARGYVLQGLGEHEGTNETISASDMMAAVERAHKTAREQGWETPGFSLLTDSPKREADPRIGKLVASFLDYRFLRAHSERVARDMNLAQVDEHPQGENAEGG